MTVIDSLSGVTPERSSPIQYTNIVYETYETETPWQSETSVVSLEFRNSNDDSVELEFRVQRDRADIDENIKRLVNPALYPNTVRYRITVEEIPA